MFYLTVAEADDSSIDEHSKLTSLNLPCWSDAFTTKQGVYVRSCGGGGGSGGGRILVVENCWL